MYPVYAARLLSAALLMSLLAPAVALADVAGRVTSSEGVPIERVRIDAIEAGGHVFTDMDGRFVLVDTAPPLQLVASHPRFHAEVIELGENDTGELEIVLVAKQEIFEEIVVSANRGESGYAPVSVAATLVEPTEVAVPPSTLTETVVQVPGVSENGQGGLFQVFSIRGISRHRVLTLIEGARVVSDRRAGVSASFIEPLLLGKVDVVQGPSSTYYGSGALGGVVQLFPRRYETLDVRVGYEGQGDENYQVVGWGDGRWSLGLARRDAGRSETPDGDEIPDGFTQISGTLRRVWETEGHEWNVMLLGSAGRDIEKASTDYPDRETIYPEENHLLMRFGVNGDTGWSASAFLHPNDLTTDVLRVGQSRTLVDNESTELGADWQRRFEVKGLSSLTLGAEYFGRRDVNSSETVTDVSGGGAPTETLQTLEDAEEDQLGGFASAEWSWGPVSGVGGVRGTWQRQVNGTEPSEDDSALSGFVGLVAPVGSGFELTGNIGTGLRFPTLSERFFIGTTGRGGVIGNPDLDSERSLSFDLGARLYGEKLFLSGYLYRTEIDDYIERIEIAPDLLTFVNLVSGTIEGAELFGSYTISRSVKLNFGGHLISGENDEGEPLADVPSNRFDLGGEGLHGKWGWRLRYEYRSSKDDPGPGEKPIPQADLLTASLSYQITDDLSLRLIGDNLLDEIYFNSADRKVPLAAGRSVGIGVAYSPAL